MKQHVGGPVIGSAYNLREIYKPSAVYQKYIIKVITTQNRTKYVYFTKENHLKLTDKIKYATSFTNKPRNFNSYVDIITRKYPGATVVLDKKYCVRKVH